MAAPRPLSAGAGARTSPAIWRRPSARSAAAAACFTVDGAACRVHVHARAASSGRRCSRVGPKPQRASKLLRVAERPEEHVPERQVRVVEGMHALLVVDAVALGTLEEVAEPVGRPHVPVVDELGQARSGHRPGGGRGPQAHQQVEDRAREHAVGEDLERVLVEAGDDLDALGAVVDLVEDPPEPGRPRAASGATSSR